DRKRLPEPEYASIEREYRAPRNAIEEIVAGIWSDVLGHKAISINDNFFELGGHSLLATQVISRVRENLQIDIALRELFQSPVLSGFAQEIERIKRAERRYQDSPIVSISRDAALPLSYAQQRLWFLDQLEPNSAAYNIPTAVRLKGKLDVA